VRDVTKLVDSLMAEAAASSDTKAA
jgi:hypothetical protein